MQPTIIMPYSPYSHGARLMSALLNIPVVNRTSYFNDDLRGTIFNADKTRNTVVVKDIKQVINWGVGTAMGLPRGMKVFNKSSAVSHAVNKLAFFTMMDKAKHGPRVPEFTTDVKEAIAWAKDGACVMARTETEGRGGAGIVFYDEDDLTQFMNAPLFVKFVLNIAEYRLHFAFGKHIYSQKKALADAVDRTTVDMRVRCHKAGFFFLSEGFTVPEDVIEQGALAYKVSGLDFCALDIVYNKYYNQAWVLEANTAMGIDEGRTAEAYARAFQENLE